MSWRFLDSLPIWQQIAENLTLRIISGEYKNGEALPSVRALASEAGVNPNTVQRAMSELEMHGLIETYRTLGRVVTADDKNIMSLKKKLAKSKINEFVSSMNSLGFNENDIQNMLSSYFEEEKR